MQYEAVVYIAEMVRHGQSCQDLSRSHVQALHASMSGAVVDAHGREGLIALGCIHAALIALGLQGDQIQAWGVCHSPQESPTLAVHDACGRLIQGIDFIADTDRAVHLVCGLLGKEADVHRDRRVPHHERPDPHHICQEDLHRTFLNGASSPQHGLTSHFEIGHRGQNLLAAHHMIGQEKLPAVERGAEALLGEV